MSSDDHASRTHPRIVFTYHDFRFFLLARLLATIGWQMQSVAIGWQVYDITGNQLYLGLIGLAQFLPNALFSLATGNVADRFDRRRISMICLGSLIAFYLTLATMMSWHGIPAHIGWIFPVLFLIGTAQAFLAPAIQSLLPMLVPAEHFAQAVTWNSSAWHFAAILGWSLGGVFYAMFGPTAVYVGGAVLTVLSFVSINMLRLRAGGLEKAAASWSTVLAGVRYVRAQKVLLGSISLDLFAVLLGGAVALMPVFAKDIIMIGSRHIGSWGLGMLRAAPGVGALVMALVVAHLPPLRRAGATMLWSVAGFGLATIIFGISRNFFLSLACLMLLGAFDMISVIVRHTLVQVITPKSMLGRVNAVNMVFIGASNELGEFESGVTARLLGTVPAVLLGGLGTIAVVALWAWLFPALRRIDRLDKVTAWEEEPEEPAQCETSKA